MSLEIIDLKFNYLRRRSLYSSLSCELGPENRTVAVLGPNGTGKSTLLKLCAGLLIPQKGQVLLNGFNISKRKKSAMEQFIYVPDTIKLPSVTAQTFANINRPFYKEFDNALFLEIISGFEVPLKRNISSLSFGQQKKVWLSFAFATNAPYLFMDEPSNGLDPKSMEFLRSNFAGAASENRTGLISTHHLNEIENLCDTYLFITSDHRLLYFTHDDIAKMYRFESSNSAPSECVYLEKGFDNYHYISKNDGISSENLNLRLFYNFINQPVNSN